MSPLPINTIIDQLLLALQSARQVLLHAPTGAGKSTWLPLQILASAALPGRIIMLEPRRLAAKSVACRLAQQLGEQPGETVGYRLRAESKVGRQTRLEVVTEGILTRMLQQDAELTGVSLVILDEFHERSLQADLALALLLDVQQGLRDDLKLLIMSATLDDSRLSQRLPQAPLLVSTGRSYPVERCYQPLAPHQRLEEGAAQAVKRLMAQQPGSLLLFLPGVTQILRVLALLRDNLPTDVDLCPLYGALPLSQQQQAIQPALAGRRKVVLATNIAETSLTIEGITLVIDCGFEHVAHYDERSGLTRLSSQRISQSAMSQRAGRAGRLAAGICWHLLSKQQAERAIAQPVPEILRSDLTGFWLELLAWGCVDITQLSWLDPPAETALASARELLQRLAAVDAQGKLTAKGRWMVDLGCEPRLAAMLLAGIHHGADGVATAALLVALLEEPPRAGQIDVAYWLHHPQPHWQRRASQLIKRCVMPTGQVNMALAELLLVHAFSDRIAQQRGQDGRYRLANGLGAVMDADDALSQQRWLVVPTLLQGHNTPDARILLALPLAIERLVSQLPEIVSCQTRVEWDENKGTLRAWQRQQVGCLTLHSQPLAKPSAQQLQQALIHWVRNQGLNVLNWDVQACQLRLRVQCAQRWLPEYVWPAMDDASLLARLTDWLSPALHGVHNLHQLRQVNVAHALAQLLDWQQKQRLDNALPTHCNVATGSRLPITYHADKPPVLAVRLQEMFGEQSNPTVAEGRVVLVLELLSPAYRPLQITRDLAAFWRGAYADVQKEMKGRYPKHLWPDDPAHTAPTRRTKKNQ
ncbi:ATP-dependent helicase HrpB [Serratia microhaemolytica]|uniref:ATP-dependent helicase HrpB n=1 Tax=Serratia microhaemolytica TaxID=2675110 RepID=UPI000FDF1FF6|nr:ATP-dependent helicase HrpB [Serratia microhaemolytica]